MSLVCKAPNVIPNSVCKLLVSENDQPDSSVSQRILGTKSTSAIGIQSELSVEDSEASGTQPHPYFQCQYFIREIIIVHF